MKEVANYLLIQLNEVLPKVSLLSMVFGRRRHRHRDRVILYKITLPQLTS